MRGSLSSPSYLVRNPTLAPQLRKTHETPPSSRLRSPAEGEGHERFLPPPEKDPGVTVGRRVSGVTVGRRVSGVTVGRRVSGVSKG